MASHFYTFEEAAQKLKVAVRSIHNYVRRGYIRKEYQGNKPKLVAEDVDRLALTDSIDLPPVNATNISLLTARIARLEQDVGLMRHILQLKDKPLRPSQSEVENLIRSAHASEQSESWRREEVSLWAGIFGSIDEVTLESIFTYAKDSHPYQPLMRLAMKLMKFTAHQRDFHLSLEAQLDYKLLDEGRKKMQSAIIAFLYATGRPVPDALLMEVSNKSSLLARLAKRAKKRPLPG